MSGSPEEVKARSSAAQKAERVYEQAAGRLLRALVEDLGIPADDAEAVLHEAFIAYITTNVEVEDPEGWLTAATLTAGKVYLDSRDLSGAMLCAADPRIVREALTLLPASAREALRLRLREGMSYADVAMALDVDPHYAQKLVSKSVATIREHVRRRKQQEEKS